MNIETLLQAPGMICKHPRAVDLRGETYLRTYPSILDFAAQRPADLTRFQQVSCMAYAWMPRALRLDQDRLEQSVREFVRAQQVTIKQLDWKTCGVEPIAACVHSVVGASKILHFTNPDVFPIWDRNVERFRLERRDLSYGHMSKVKNYIDYVNDVHAMLNDESFAAFRMKMADALRVRLNALKIRPYKITDIRAIEMAAFEMAKSNVTLLGAGGITGAR